MPHKLFQPSYSCGDFLLHKKNRLRIRIRSLKNADPDSALCKVLCQLFVTKNLSSEGL
jgi:hypothetical protein